LTYEHLFDMVWVPPLLSCVFPDEAAKKMQEQLDVAINSIRVRFGSQALTRAAELPPPQPWPSGTPIDRLSGSGGCRAAGSLF